MSNLKHELNKKLEMLLDVDRTEEVLDDLLDTQVRLNWEMEREEVYWEQRAKVNWLKAGERNTTFFHNHANKRRRVNTIQRLEFFDGWTTSINHEMEGIATIFLKTYSLLNRVRVTMNIFSRA